jgi:type I restriction-modification system DNA methylase subunit
VAALISMSQIAELAGVTPAAVSNWRKRFEDFPTPAGKSDAGHDLFDLDAVERWLRSTGRTSPDTAPERFMIEASDPLRNSLASADSADVLCAALALRTVAGPAASISDAFEVADAQPDLHGVFDTLRNVQASMPEVAEKVYDAARAAPPDAVQPAFEYALSRQDRFSGQRTSPALVDLVASVVSLQDDVRTVFDPAAGTAGLLVEAQALTGADHLVGQEVNSAAWQLARQRLLIQNLDGEIRHGNSLENDAFPDLKFDAVVCDPPYGQQGELHAIAGDPRWILGLPGTRNLDFAWLQHSLHHVAAGGRAYVISPAGTLFRGGREADLRRQMLRRGHIEAVISLPERLALHTTIPLALWVLDPVTVRDRQPRERVLLVDLRAADVPESLADVATGILRTWRSSGEVEGDNASLAAAVDVFDLVGKEANLEPARWVATNANPDAVQEQQQAYINGWPNLRRLVADLADAPAAVELEPEPAPWVSIDDLLSEHRISAFRGTPVKPEERAGTGTRVWRLRDLTNQSDGDQFYVAELDGKRSSQLTQPGDILVGVTGGRIVARVDERGNSLAAYPLQTLRLSQQWMDPHVAAALLASERNARFVYGSSVQRLDLRACQLPLLSLAQSERLRSALDAVDVYSRAASGIMRQAGSMRAAAIEIAGAGQIPTPGPGGRYE